MTSPLIIALDLEGNDALRIARSLDPDKCNLKVGNQLFSSEGPRIINDLKKLGFNIFLDLKFHDIPNTVSLALKECIKMGVWMVNVHALGGREMLLLASKTIEESEFKPILVGVTLLTSLTNSSLKNIGINKKVEDEVLHLAKLSKECGLEGVVCSPNEVSILRAELGKDFILVTPGIRSIGEANNDQNRISTPKNAINLGATFIVMGREIINSKTPSNKVEDVLQNISQPMKKI